MSTLTSKLIIALVDQVTAPSRAIAASINRLTSAQARNTARLNAVRGQMLDAVGVGYALARSIAAPISAATEFETKLEDIGQKIDLPVAQLPKLGAELRAVARDTTQTAAAISEGMDVLAGMGASREDALGLLNPIGKAATAYNAEIADLSQAGYAALDNLKVPAQEFGRALDAMAQAGKAGAFELKDMAKYFPQLGAGYQALGQTGVPAVADLSAALQIVRKGTGDAASAATNLSNILQKVNAPLTRKNFAKMGVDLEKEMQAAAKKGMTPIEAIAEITSRTLKGNLGRLGDLFSDAQVQQGLRPLIQNLDEYRRIRAEALAAQGTVEEDYQRRLQTGALATRRWQIAMESLNLAIGNALLPALTSLANDIIPIVNAMAEWADRHPALTRAIVATTAGLVGLRVAAIAAQFGFLWMKGGLLATAIGGLKGLQGAGRIAALALTPVTAGLRALRAAMIGYAAAAAIGGHGSALAAMGTSLLGLLNPLRLVAAAMRILRVALIGSGIGLALAAIAAAGIWIYNNWVGVSTAFEAFKGAFMRALAPVMPAIQPVIDGIGWLWESVSSLLGPIDEMNGGWAAAGIAAGKFAGETVAAVIQLPAQIGAALAAGWQAVVGWFSSAVASVSGFLSSVGALLSGGEGDWRNFGSVIGEAVGGAIRGLIDLAPQAFDALVTAAMDGALRTVEALRSLGAEIISILSSIDLSAVGRQIIESLLEGIKSAGAAVLGYARDIGSGIKNAVSGAASGFASGIKRGLGLGEESPAVASARAAGGPVRAGGTYLVGEHSPELVTFPQAGRVHDALKTARILRNAALASALTALPAAAMPSVPAVDLSAVRGGSGQQEARGGRQAPSISIAGGAITISVQAAAGQSPEQIAVEVERRLSARLNAISRGAFSDGAN